MAINRVSLTSQSITTNTESVVEIIYAAPPGPEEVLDPPQTPGKLVAYYNGSRDQVRLYIVNRAGLRLLPM